MEQKDLGKQPAEGVRRREVLKTGLKILGGVTAAAAVSQVGHLVPPLIDDILQNEEQTPDLRRKIERKFDIELLTEAEKDSKRPSEIIPAEWSENRLRLLEQILSFLPEHFYKPNKGVGPWAKKAQFFVGQIKQRTIGGECICGDSTGGQDKIRMQSYMISPEEPDWAFVFLTHELTHRGLTEIERDRDNEYDRNFFKYGKARNIQYKIADSIRSLAEKNGLQLNLDDLIERKLKEVIMPAVNQVRPEDRGKMIFYITAFYGFGSDIELGPTAASIYIFGEEYFNKMWGEFLSSRDVSTLYNLTKKNAFRGQEYDGTIPWVK